MLRTPKKQTTARTPAATQQQQQQQHQQQQQLEKPSAHAPTPSGERFHFATLILKCLCCQGQFNCTLGGGQVLTVHIDVEIYEILLKCLKVIENN